MPRAAQAGRVCIVCKDRQPYANFRRDNGFTGRICRLCRISGAHVDDFACVCVVCDVTFAAHNSTARYCSPECRDRNHTRKVRQARRLARLRRKEKVDAGVAPSRARTDLDHA